jgi:NADH dehydrogenase
MTRGHRVRLLVHQRHVGLEPELEQFEADATLLPGLEQAARGCEATINLIGIIREFPSRGVTFERLHVEATANLLAASRSAGVSRFLQMSALGTRADASTGYFRTKFRAEELVRASGLDYTIFRPSVIFGPKDEFVNQLAGLMRSLPVMPVIGSGNYQMQPVSADDVARCFADALEKPELIGNSYPLCGPDRLSYNEILDAIASAIGKRHLIRVQNPVGLMRLVVPVLQRLPFFPLTSDQLEMLLEGNVCDTDWTGSFGFKPTGFVEGIRRYLKP